MLFFALIVIVTLLVSGLGWELKKRHQPPPMDAGLFMRFALLPGERHGQVWPAAHPDGHPMIATITSKGVFALNYAIAQAAPIRLRPEGLAVAGGPTQMITPGATEPMVEVTLSGPDQAPLTFRIAQSGAKALAAWATQPR